MYCKHCGSPMKEHQAVCLQCGAGKGTGNSFCPNCGNEVTEAAAFCINCGTALTATKVVARPAPHTNSTITYPQHTPTAQHRSAPQHRSIVVAIILTIVTCGIYGLYWMICITDEMNQLAEVNDTSGGTAVLLSFITCGIYSIYWAYRLGEKRDIVEHQNGSSNILYLVLSVLGLGILVHALAQDAINKAIERNRY